MLFGSYTRTRDHNVGEDCEILRLGLLSVTSQQASKTLPASLRLPISLQSYAADVLTYATTYANILVGFTPFEPHRKHGWPVPRVCIVGYLAGMRRKSEQSFTIRWAK